MRIYESGPGDEVRLLGESIENSVFAVQVPPGRHTFFTSELQHFECDAIEGDLAPGRVYYVRAWGDRPERC